MDYSIELTKEEIKTLPREEKIKLLWPYPHRYREHLQINLKSENWSAFVRPAMPTCTCR